MRATQMNTKMVLASCPIHIQCSEMFGRIRDPPERLIEHQLGLSSAQPDFLDAIFAIAVLIPHRSGAILLIARLDLHVGPGAFLSTANNHFRFVQVELVLAWLQFGATYDRRLK